LPAEADVAWSAFGSGVLSKDLFFVYSFRDILAGTIFAQNPRRA